jgi:drug/metabolite transporter (DMT)-like permease
MTGSGSGAVARRSALAMILAANVLGGLSYPWQGLALRGLPPATVTALRTCVALACLSGLMLARGERLWPAYDRAAWRRVALIGTAAFALPLLLGIAGIRRAGATNGALLILLEPAAILVLSRCLLGERIRPLQWCGIALGALGALVIAGEGASLAEMSSQLAGADLGGNLSLIASAIAWGLYSPVAKPLAERHPASGITLWTMLLGMLVLAPAALLERGEWRDGPDLWPALAWTAVLGVLVSFLSIVMWVKALAHLPASLVAVFVFVQPVAGAVAADVQLGERLSAHALAGGAVIALGVAAVIWPARGREPGARAA